MPIAKYEINHYENMIYKCYKLAMQVYINITNTILQESIDFTIMCISV